MSYAPPPGPHGGVPPQRQWGAAPQVPQPYRGPAAPRKFLVLLVGLMVSVASLSAVAFTVLWWDNTAKESGVTDTTVVKQNLPGPRGIGADVPPVTGGAGSNS